MPLRHQKGTRVFSILSYSDHPRTGEKGSTTYKIYVYTGYFELMRGMGKEHLYYPVGKSGEPYTEYDPTSIDAIQWTEQWGETPAESALAKFVAKQNKYIAEAKAKIARAKALPMPLPGKCQIKKPAKRSNS